MQKFLEVEPALLLADGFDDCLIGLGVRDGQWVAIYSIDQMIQELAKTMSEEDAIDYFEYNIQGAYMGPKTPIYLWGSDYWDSEKAQSAESWSVADEEPRSGVSRREPT